MKKAYACLSALILLPSCKGQTLEVGSNEAGVVSTLGDGGENPWACLGQPPETTDESPVTITLNVADALEPIDTAGFQGGSDLTVLSFTGVSGVAVQECNRLDALCSTPLSVPVVTSDAGEATIVTPDNFDGYFQFGVSGYVPAMLYMGNLAPGISTFAPPAEILSTAGAETFSAVLDVPISLDAGAGVGLVFLQVFDCFDRNAAGVAFTLSSVGADTVQWYGLNAIPSTAVKQTDSLGTGGALNVPVGSLLVTATLAATGQTVGTSDIFVRPGQMTTAWVRARTQ